MRVLDWYRYVLLAVASFCLTIFVCLSLYSWVFQTWENRRFERESQRVAAETTPAPAHPARGKPHTRAPLPDGPLGRISIPRLHLSAIVEEGDDDATLSAAVGHIRGTSYPGSPGNTALAGHRDTFFAGLRDLQKGDEIVFETRTAKYRYVVDTLLVVDPKNTSVLASAGEPRLTLVTCFPFHYIGPAPHRFIAQARQVAATPKTRRMAGAVPRSVSWLAGNSRPE